MFLYCYGLLIVYLLHDTLIMVIWGDWNMMVNNNNMWLSIFINVDWLVYHIRKHLKHLSWDNSQFFFNMYDNISHLAPVTSWKESNRCSMISPLAILVPIISVFHNITPTFTHFIAYLYLQIMPSDTIL